MTKYRVRLHCLSLVGLRPMSDLYTRALLLTAAELAAKLPNKL
jgi:hypothetical protein